MNKNSTCFICGKPLTKNNLTEEHIFLAFLGDSLKDNHLICRHCNSELGDKIDGPFSNTLKPLIKLLHINNRDSKNPMITAIDTHTRIPYLINTDNQTAKIKHPKVKVSNFRKNKNSIHMTVNGYSSNETNAKNILTKSLKRKGIKDTKDAIEQIQFKKHSYKPKLNISNICPDFRLNSIEFIKMATEFALHCGLNAKYFSNEQVMLKNVLTGGPRLQYLNKNVFLYIKISTLCNKKINHKYFMDNNRNIRKIRALLFVNNHKLYCSISFLGLTFSIPLDINHKINTNKCIISKYHL